MHVWLVAGLLRNQFLSAVMFVERLFDRFARSGQVHIGLYFLTVRALCPAGVPSSRALSVGEIFDFTLGGGGYALQVGVRLARAAVPLVLVPRAGGGSFAREAAGGVEEGRPRGV